MTDLAEWLLAQIADDEAAARAAEPAPWTAHGEASDPEEGYVAGPDGYVLIYNEGTVSLATAAHIARHDPARVLADCAAKRRIVMMAQFVGAAASPPGDLATSTTITDGRYRVLHDVLLALAQPFADRPGFDPAWRIDP